jgi:hypothetical protein
MFLKLAVGILECGGCITFTMDTNLVTLCMRPPEKIIRLIMKVFVVRLVSKFFSDDRNKRMVVKLKYYMTLGARIFHVMVEQYGDQDLCSFPPGIFV